MIFKKKPVVLTATDLLVQRFRDMPRHAEERLFREDRLQFLMNEFDAGRFRSPVWAEALCASDGRTYRLNGQHTSHMYAALPLGDRPPVVLEQFEVDTKDEVAALFSTYDAQASARTTGDITRATFAMSILAEEGLSPRIGNVVVAGIGLADQAVKEWMTEVQVVGSGHRGHTQYERAKRCSGELEFVRFLKPFLAIHSRTLFLRAPVAAALYLTFKVDAAAASTFWEAVQWGTDGVGAPSRLLRDFLMTRKLGGGRESAGVREMLGKCLQAWNFTRSGHSLARLSQKEISLIPKPV